MRSLNAPSYFLSPARLIACLLLIMLATAPAPADAQRSTVIDVDLSEPVPLVDEGASDRINLLLMGSATRYGDSNPGLTDSLMIVSIDPDNSHVAVISLPRDLYVYAENYGHHKVNQIYFYAEMSRSEERDGSDVLKDTIEHNLGLHIDYYARVDFNEFGNLIDEVGGIDIAVDCAIKDWRLIEPDLDPHVEENWEMVTMWAGRYHFDGDTALWYVRSRRTSSDIDRGRRQQDVLRALWHTLRADGLVENFPERWEQFNNIVETDMTLEDALPLLPVARELSASDVDFYTFQIGQEIYEGYTQGKGRFVFAPHRDAIATLLQQALTTPTQSRLNQHAPTVAIYNGSGVPDLDYVAAQRLQREGFHVVITHEWTHPRNHNKLVDHTGASKGNPVHIIQDVLSITDEGLFIEPDAEREYDYELHIGNQYQFYACTFGVVQPDWEERDDEQNENERTAQNN
jgi:LCP family protein required for cell wall assembly